MYTIMADGEILYSPTLAKTDKAYAAINPRMTQELNKAGSLSFTILPGNRKYNDIKMLKTIITVLRDGEEIFRGRISDINTDTYLQKNVYAEGELAFLLDSVQRPYEYKGAVSALFSMLIDEHNAQVEAEKQFTIGNITAVSAEEETHVKVSEYSDTLTEITGKLIDVYGGYIKIRVSGNTRYIDYLSEYGANGQQGVTFGVNLVSLDAGGNSNDIFTVLIPLGASDKDENGEMKPLDVKGANGGLDYIEDQAGIQKFGRIVRPYTWSHIDDADKLLQKGLEHLAYGITENATLTIRAVDMHLLDGSIESIRLGDYVNISAQPHGIERREICAKIDHDFINPENTVYTFGIPKKALTENVVQMIKKMGGGGGGGLNMSLEEEILWLERWANHYIDEDEARYEILTGQIDHINGRVSDAEILLDGVEADIALVAEEYNKLDASLKNCYSLIEVNTDNINLHSQTIEGINKDLASANLRIDGVAGSITTLTEKQEEIDGELLDLESSIEQNASSISAHSQSISTLSGRITSASARIDGVEGSITTLTKKQTEIDGELSDLESSIEQQAGSISAHSQSISTLSGRITSASARIDGVEGSITTLTKKQTEIDGELSDLESSIEQHAGSISAHSQSINKLSGDMTSASARIDGVEGSITTLTTKQEEIDGELLDLESSIEQNAGSIELNSQSINKLSGDMTSANLRINGVEGSITTLTQKQTEIDGELLDLESSIDQQAGSIEFMSKSIDKLNGDIAIAELRIDGVEGSITSKVSKGSIISEINQSAEAVTISASKINLNGYVTASELNASVADILLSNSLVIDTQRLTADNGEVTILSASSFTLANNHVMIGTLSMGALVNKKVLSTSQSVDLAHSHKVSVSDDGTVTLGEVSATGGNFKIADTKAYKDGVSAAKASGAASVTLDKESPEGWVGGTFRVKASNGAIYTVNLPTLTTNVSTFNDKYTAVAYVTTPSIPNIISSAIVDASGIYEDGYKAGWAAAKAMIRHDQDDKRLFFGPSSVVDEEEQIFRVTVAAELTGPRNSAKGVVSASAAARVYLDGTQILYANQSGTLNINAGML